MSITILAVLAAAVLLGSAATPLLAGARRATALYHPPPGGPAPPRPDPALPLREGRIRSGDGLELATWTVPGRGPHTVVVCHPVGRARAAVLGQIELLHRAGHHVVAYDLRNHGASGQDPRLWNMAERFTADLRAVLVAVRADPQLGAGRTGVLALSFSTWAAIHLLRDPAAPVDAVACDSGPGLDIAAAMRRYFALHRRLLPRGLRTWPGYWLARTGFVTAAGWRLRARGWPPDLAGQPRPLLFIAAGRDVVIPPEQIRAVARRAPAGQLWVADRAIHANALRLARTGYTDRLTRFFADAFTTVGDPVHG